MNLNSFIQKNCIILQLALHYKSNVMPNQAILHSSIASSIASLGSVLYCHMKPRDYMQSVKRYPQTIDLVCSSNDIGKLSVALLNLRGFSVDLPSDLNANHMEMLSACAVTSPLDLPENSRNLDKVYQDLLSNWKKTDHRNKSGSKEVQPFIHVPCSTSTTLFFSNQPSVTVPTSDGKVLDLKSSSSPALSYNTEDFQGSRFFEFDRWLPRKHNANNLRSERSEIQDFFYYVNALKKGSGRHCVFLEPQLISDFDSLPQSLKRWLTGATDEDIDSWSPQDDSRLEFLLNGFNGFKK